MRTALTLATAAALTTDLVPNEVVVCEHCQSLVLAAGVDAHTNLLHGVTPDVS